MEYKYIIKGMTCGGCLAKVNEALKSQDNIEVVSIDLNSGETIIRSQRTPSVERLNKVLMSKGRYTIELPQTQPRIKHSEIESGVGFSLITYKPLFLIILFILGVALLAQYPFESFQTGLLMRHFMAGFFIVFSFFKLLNLEGFVMSYAMYDIIAARWKPWGYIYPFIELFLGLLFLTNQQLFFANWSTVVILGIGLIGVTRSVFSKRTIQCACLGDVFNLPMSSVTIIENGSMIGMALIMLII